MNPKFFGDSYDFVKRCIIVGLAPANEWAIHPMYLDYRAQPFDPTFARRYADFLGIHLLQGDVYARGLVRNVASAWPHHVFLDPDTGLRIPIARPPGGWNKYVGMDEFARVAGALRLRQHQLTMIYDQSYARANPETRNRQVEAKLNILRDCYGLHAVAYVSHVVFIWASLDERVVVRATQRLLEHLAIPPTRLVYDHYLA